MRMSWGRMAAYLGVVIAVGLSLVGCGEDGGGPGTTQTSTVQGNVAEVMAGLPMENGVSRFTQLRHWLAFPTLAHAQAAAVADIRVTAQLNGRIVAITTTDMRGNFTLNVPAGTLTLFFTTSAFNVSTELDVPLQRVIIIVVVLQPSDAEPVLIREQAVVTSAQAAIRCETGVVDLTKLVDQELVIDGRGEDCIRAEGNCSVQIDPEHISLVNCAHCIDAGGVAQVTLIAPNGDIRCDARQDGIRARGNASVDVSAMGSAGSGGNIVIDSTGDHGILAEGTAQVTLSAQQEVFISGSDDAGIRAQGTPSVALTATSCTVTGTEEAIGIGGNAFVDTQGCGALELIDETP